MVGSDSMLQNAHSACLCTAYDRAKTFRPSDCACRKFLWGRKDAAAEEQLLSGGYETTAFIEKEIFGKLFCWKIVEVFTGFAVKGESSHH